MGEFIYLEFVSFTTINFMHRHYVAIKGLDVDDVSEEILELWREES